MKKRLIIVLTAVFLLVCLGSGAIAYKMYNNNMRSKIIVAFDSAIDNSDATETVLQICTFEKKINDEASFFTLEQKLSDKFETYCTEYDYSKYKYMDEVTKKLKAVKTKNSDQLMKKLQKILDNNKSNRLLAALQGTWQRDDNGALSGMLIELKTAENSTTAIITKSVQNSYGFTTGDLKWKNIIPINENMFSYSDLFKTMYGEYSEYADSTGTYDFDHDCIDISVTGAGPGLQQHWSRCNSSATAIQSKNNTYATAIQRKSNTYAKVNNPQDSSTIFPSDTTYISASDLDGRTKENIALMRNEIYARHGYIFKTEPYKTYFNNKTWYYPNLNFNENMLSSIEKSNVRFISAYEKNKGW